MYRGGARGGQAGPWPTPKNYKLFGYPYTYIKLWGYDRYICGRAKLTED
jgi:hypothetical protein